MPPVMSKGDTNCVIEHKGKEFVISGECSAWKPYLSREPFIPQRPPSPTLQIPADMNTSKSAPVSPVKMHTSASEVVYKRSSSDDTRRASPLREAVQWFFKPIKPQESGLTRDINIFSPQST